MSDESRTKSVKGRALTLANMVKRNGIALAACALLAVQVSADDVAMVRLGGTPAEIGRTWGAMNKRAIAHDMDVHYLKEESHESSQKNHQ